MRNRKRRRRRVISELNLTNLIDVVFALLIIFMITAPMMTQGVQVDLPETESQNVEAHESIQVSINSSNEIFIDHQKVPLVEFRARFRDVFAGRSNIPVFVNSDKKVPYGLVMRVISDIQNAGVVKLGFLTTPLQSEDGY
ncbi:biopolymer transporter ExbD [Chitinispirillales bacterium ANBcel5]|uniref:ExbD/TolR family protein n=1 Tax=Cellulosispirillum alkaliphilum TaxID=3039283 RepID=UPI002A5109E6|nr:biopolymer transporter ExbD [Chitinispirillales bacterium ANBcel5]